KFAICGLRTVEGPAFKPIEHVTAYPKYMRRELLENINKWGSLASIYTRFKGRPAPASQQSLVHRLSRHDDVGGMRRQAKGAKAARSRRDAQNGLH
ncbi:hypothetical protein KXW70_009098, partial [Aspergillus fumigatus]